MRVPGRNSWVTLVPALGATLLLAASLSVAPDDLSRVRVCAFDRLVGLPCPACGLVRGFCALSHGEVSRSLGYHPFSLPLYGFVLALASLPLVVRRAPRLVERCLGSAWLPRIAIGWVAALTAYGLCRIWVQF